ncbi:MAG: hypothetical protein HQK49_15760 [Oligoflexia bacterium]|nr:hypothetical protein [Oligoflexia bacterium]
MFRIQPVNFLKLTKSSSDLIKHLVIFFMIFFFMGMDEFNQFNHFNNSFRNLNEGYGINDDEDDQFNCSGNKKRGFYNKISNHFMVCNTFGIYPTVKLQKEYIHMDKMMNVKYFGEDPKDLVHIKTNCRISVVDKKIYYTDYQSNKKMQFTSKEGTLIYVMDSKGEIYICPPSIKEKIIFFHSSVLAGGDVAAAGEIIFDDNGNVKMINRNSGHYKPSNSCLDNVVKEMINKGVDISKDAKVTGDY